MSQRDLIDPESRGVLEELLERVPGGFNAIPDIAERRAVSASMRVQPEVAADARVTKEDRTVAGPAGQPDIGVRVYRPSAVDGTLPGIYVIHGGGMIMGDVEGEDPTATVLCDELQAVVVSVEYRLAPSTPTRPVRRTATPGCSGRRPTPRSSASTSTGSRSTAGARAAGSRWPPRCWRGTGRARRSAS